MTEAEGGARSAPGWRQVPTPALVIDVEAMERNIAEIGRFFAGVAAKVRPHFKTHKCPEIACRQMAAGAIGLTCAKLGEAEVLVEAGIGSILIANEIVDPVKIQRLAQLQRQSEVIVAVDDEGIARQTAEAARVAGTTIPVVVEVNVGLNRCGVEPGEPALGLARVVAGLPGLRFAGLLGYEGQAMFVTERRARGESVSAAMGKLVGTAALIREAGLRVEIVSAGGTGTYDLTGSYPGVTEVEAGSYVLMDAKYEQSGLPFRRALALVATVISVPRPNRAIIDAGIKAISQENGLPVVVSPEGARLIALNEEHGHLEVDPAATRLHVGDRVELWPTHVCTTVNLHDRFYVAREGRVEAEWKIAGRGKVQ